MTFGESPDSGLRDLARLRQRRLELDCQEAAAAVAARHAGLAWVEIADGLGMRERTALRRFGPVVDDRRPPEGLTQEVAAVELRRITQERLAAEQAEVEAVLGLRAARVTWGRIATALGAKEPNVVAKYKPLLSGSPPGRQRRSRAIRTSG